jgi:hypothetical protein
MQQVPAGKNSNNYANVGVICKIAQQQGVDAVWPGWGHASEKPELPDTLASMGIKFIGERGLKGREREKESGIDKCESKGSKEQDTNRTSNKLVPLRLCGCCVPFMWCHSTRTACLFILLLISYSVALFFFPSSFFLGPNGSVMSALGDKIAANILAQTAKVPSIPWSGSYGGGADGTEPLTSALDAQGRIPQVDGAPE